MSEENVELWRAVVQDAFFAPEANEFDAEAAISRMAELWDPDVEFDLSAAPVLDISGVYLGADASRRFWREWLVAWQTVEFDYTMVDAGSQVVMPFNMRMRGRSTGIEVPLGKVAWVATFRDRLVIHAKFYLSQSEAFKAAGLSE